jgi:hypothetical protein
MTGERVFWSRLKRSVPTNLNAPRHRRERYCPGRSNVHMCRLNEAFWWSFWWRLSLEATYAGGGKVELFFAP